MSGIVWPDSGTSVPTAIKDVYGHRPFSSHVATVGYDNDFHRGVDVDLALGDSYKSIIGGHVIRKHYTHFQWNDDENIDEWEADADGGASPATFLTSGGVMTITGTRGGTGTFPNVAKLIPATERIVHASDWEFRVQLSSTTDPAAGAFGFGAIDEATGENVRMEWDGVNATALGTNGFGLLASNGTTRAVTTEPWLRVFFTGTTLKWEVSADADTWLSVASQSAGSYTNTSSATWVPFLYWRSTDTDGTPATIQLSEASWYDTQSVDRFGNQLTVAQSDRKVVCIHFGHISVNQGDIVEPGQVLGTVGLTGFDARSGRINEPHVHAEIAPVTSPVYTATESVNPLASGLLPRANVSNNVTVTRSTANDPDAVDSWRLRIQIARADQDFDLNEVSLTADLATRAVNLDTRSGLNTDNDIPLQSGVYIVAESFNEDSSEYEVSYYFHKSVVGSTFTSAFVKDCDGNTLWSE